jgi:fructokinase
VNQPVSAGWPAVVCLGEVLTDFVALDNTLPLRQVTKFQRAAGGAPANVAVALTRLGTGAAFIGKVGGATTRPPAHQAECLE